MGEKLRKRLAQKTLEAADRLDLPQVLAPDIPRMELLGNRASYMDRHRHDGPGAADRRDH